MEETIIDLTNEVLDPIRKEPKIKQTPPAPRLTPKAKPRAKHIAKLERKEARITTIKKQNKSRGKAMGELKKAKPLLAYSNVYSTKETIVPDVFVKSQFDTNYSKTEVKFVSSFISYKDCPEPYLPEYAFIGRSNVGKSSLINYLTSSKTAKTSAKPGKTQLINHFEFTIDSVALTLVDLPGYGYAKSAKTNRNKWSQFTSDYFLKCSSLRMVFVLIDASIETQQIDLEFIEFLKENHIKYSIVFTKIDKDEPKEIAANIKEFRTNLFNWKLQPALFFEASVNAKKGAMDILKYLHNTSAHID